MNIYNQNEIEELASILKNDGIISVPTDTVYGICGCVNSKKVFEKLVNLKNRPKYKAFPIMCTNLEQIKNFAIVNSKAEMIINKLMPGPITIVLNKQKEIPGYITNEKNTIAVRMATSDFLKELIQKVNCPIFMSSANKSGEKTCNTIKEIKEKFNNIDAIVDGKVTFGQASTIIDCTSDQIKIIREGPISLEEILYYEKNID